MRKGETQVPGLELSTAEDPAGQVMATASLDWSGGSIADVVIYNNRRFACARETCRTTAGNRPGLDGLDVLVSGDHPGRMQFIDALQSPVLFGPVPNGAPCRDAGGDDDGHGVGTWFAGPDVGDRGLSSQ